MTLTRNHRNANDIVDVAFAILLGFCATTPSLAITVNDVCNFGHSVSTAPTPSNPCSFIGGLFSVHQDKINPFSLRHRCSLSDFHRFGVEQAEALIFAVELLLEESRNSSISGYSIYDSCGIVPSHGLGCVRDQARALVIPDNKDECALATIVGPFYWGDTSDSLVYNNVELRNVFNQAFGVGTTSTEDKRGVLSLVDQSIAFASSVPAQRDEQLVFMQPSCQVQVSAVVDFLLAARWREVVLVTSGDDCGQKNSDEFRKEIEDRRLACDIRAEYYTHSKDLPPRLKRDEKDVPILNNLWRNRLDKPSSPRAIVVLSSMLFALHFFESYMHFETMNQTTFGFLLGDFWGNPVGVDALYDVLMDVTETARTVVALRTATNGLDKFQEHMTSIRANSTEIRRNSLLADYWENYFNCSMSNGTCDNTTSLPYIDRPILRNYKASLVIDAAFLVAEYVKRFREEEGESLRFTTSFSIFYDKRAGRERTTNVSSWTGNQVRLGPVRGHTQPVTWSYEFLVLTRENGSIPYGVWTFEDEGNRTGSFESNESDIAIWTPEHSPSLRNCLLPTEASTTAEMPSTERSSPKENGTTEEPVPALLSTIAVPIVVLLLHIVCCSVVIFLFQLKWIRRVPSVLLILLTLLSVALSFLVFVDVFSPFDCKILALDFAINAASVLCLAPFFVEVLLHAFCGMYNRAPIKVLLVAVIVIIEIVVAGVASFRSSDSESECLDARSRPLVVVSYWINAGLAIGTVIIIWITHVKKYPSRLDGRSIVECVVATLLAVVHVVGISLVLWVNNDVVQAHWLVVLAAFPAMVTLYVASFLAWNKYKRRSKRLPRPIQGKRLETSTQTMSLLL